MTETLPPRSRKVKILATLGPASSTPQMIRKLMLAGADAFRINMSHGDQKQKAKLVGHIRALEKGQAGVACEVDHVERQEMVDAVEKAGVGTPY